jgi:hypothetical protein
MTLGFFHSGTFRPNAPVQRGTRRGAQTHRIPFGDDELFAIGELLQMAGLRRHSGTLVLRQRRTETRLTFRDGCLATAQYADLERTLADVLGWRQGTAVLVSHPVLDNPERLFAVESVLLNAVRSLDERQAFQIDRVLGPAADPAEPPRQSRRWPRLSWWTADRRHQADHPLAFPQ